MMLGNVVAWCLMINPETDRVLITGAAGAIGTALRTGLRDRWRRLRLTDIRPIPDLANNEEAIITDVADRSAVETMMRDVKAVVHLAGVLGSYTLEDLFRVNARGLFDVLESARLAGVERIVFASSNHAFGCYPIAEPVSPALPPRPDSLYGVFKVWGETLLRNYYDRHGIRSVSLRIGTFRALPIDQRSLATWLSPADVAQLVDVSLRHPDPGCMVVNGYSNNTRLKTDDPNWAVLGYKPRDNAEDYREMLREKGVDVEAPDRDAWEWPEHGGSFARAPERPVR
ncbi:MAG TPA: NAD(P)-dependent oxidoreductase [Acetobacteraceae bacterium]